MAGQQEELQTSELREAVALEDEDEIEELFMTRALQMIRDEDSTAALINRRA